VAELFHGPFCELVKLAAGAGIANLHRTKREAMPITRAALLGCCMARLPESVAAKAPVRHSFIEPPDDAPAKTEPIARKDNGYGILRVRHVKQQHGLIPRGKQDFVGLPSPGRS
jgi:hypothetical protein